MSFDSRAYAYFVSAISSALQQVKLDTKDDIFARTYLFVFANAIWGSFVKIATQDEHCPTGKDQLFRQKLKSLAQKVLQSISAAESWETLAIRISTAIESWVSENSDVTSNQEVFDLDVRKSTLHFSEIFFNACYRQGNPLEAPKPFDAALQEINRELWIWHDSL